MSVPGPWRLPASAPFGQPVAIRDNGDWFRVEPSGEISSTDGLSVPEDLAHYLRRMHEDWLEWVIRAVEDGINEEDK